eukprot:5199274-Pyramimonas_sp.AAC.1
MEMSFVGLQMTDGHTVSLKTKNIWRLRLGIESLLRRGKATGKVMQCVAGHIAWSTLLRREG